MGLALGLVAAIATARGQREGGNRRGWTIPQGAAQEANPIAVTPGVLAKGKKLYEDNCQKCHGKGGKGDGPDADPDGICRRTCPIGPRRAQPGRRDVLQDLERAEVAEDAGSEDGGPLQGRRLDGHPLRQDVPAEGLTFVLTTLESFRSGAELAG